MREDSKNDVQDRVPPVWTWSIGKVALEVRHGSLLAAPERSWVNSEQTDFILAWSGPSISAQLRQIWPNAQDELDAQTRGRKLPAGTVLTTSGPEARRIYHAGFHDPDAWYYGDEDAAAVFLEHIQSCIDQILDTVIADGLHSVAFPLIGTGIFGLPVERFAEVFFDSVIEHARRSPTRLDVVLCVRSSDDVPLVVQHGTRVFAARLGGGGPILAKAGGHPLVRRLRDRPCHQSDPAMAKKDLLEFGEIALATDLAVSADICCFSAADVLQTCSRSSGCEFTFGLRRDRLDFILANMPQSVPAWFRPRRGFLRRSSAREAIGRLIKDRNDFAHLRKPRDVMDITADIETLFGPVALPEPWPDVHRHWVRRIGEDYALLNGADFARQHLTWLMPSTRRQIKEEMDPCFYPEAT